jgi:hypothetical protein
MRNSKPCSFLSIFFLLTSFFYGTDLLADDDNLDWENLVETKEEQDEDSHSSDKEKTEAKRDKKNRKKKKKKKKKKSKRKDKSDSAPSDDDEYDTEQERSADNDFLKRFQIALTLSSQLFTDVNPQGGSSFAFANNYSIAPDLWFNLNSKTRLGWVHSYNGGLGIWSGVAQTICLGDDFLCDGSFIFSAFRGIYEIVKSGSLTVAADGTFFLTTQRKQSMLAPRSETSLATVLRIGTIVKYDKGNIAFTTTPSVTVVVPGTDGGNGSFTDTNKLYLPISLTATFGSTQIGAQYVLDKYLDVLFDTAGTGNNLNLQIGHTFANDYQASFVWGVINGDCIFECSGLNATVSKMF